MITFLNVEATLVPITILAALHTHTHRPCGVASGELIENGSTNAYQQHHAELGLLV